ncbi:MAG: polysaccharide pyruvyl transferase family protein [Candidatus Bathyarchaeota archaeon]|nr:polysaccharide pyruvyl transferase family protein [Candidatus Bathyarchaeota archaeon]
MKNLGDEAFLSVMLHRFRQETPNAHITVLSFNPAETKKLHRVEALNALGLKAFISLIMSNKIVLGGGGIFDTYVGGSINLTSYYSLAVSAIGILMKKNIQFYAIGANSLFNRFVKLALFFVMNRPNVTISVRDSDSKGQLKSVGVNKNIKVVMDPAADLPIESRDISNVILQEHNVNLDKKLVGFTLRYIGGPNEKIVLSSISKFIDWLIEQNMEVVFIPMAKASHKKEENDLLFAQEIIARIKHKKDLKVITNDLTPSQVKSIINRLDLLVGMRFHSFIFAHSTNTPFIGISYSQKVSAFLNSISEQELKIEHVSFETLKKIASEKLRLETT